MNTLTDTRPPGAMLSPRLAAMLAIRMPVELPSFLHWHSTWTTHLPFAAWLVAAARPRSIAELGVQQGVSYCTFVEEMARQRIEGSAIGVDTFGGDAHTGAYDGGILALLKAHHDTRYGHFSRLLQTTFDEAAAGVPAGSVDLLHIDGLHTYEAVRHDFETWLPKLSPRGIVLFHDTEVRSRDFGVWRFWAEVSAGRPNFSFLHGHGLGVLGVGPEIPDALRPLFEADPQEVAQIRAVFVGLGEACRAATPKRPPQRKPLLRRLFPRR